MSDFPNQVFSRLVTINARHERDASRFVDTSGMAGGLFQCVIAIVVINEYRNTMDSRKGKDAKRCLATLISNQLT